MAKHTVRTVFSKFRIMKTLSVWLDEYAESHRNPVNKRLHWLCIPPIVFSVLGLLRAVPLGNDWINVATVAGVLALLYYAVLSRRLALGMTVLGLLMYWGVEASDHGIGVWHLPLMAAIFVLAWIGQFVGHRIEGARPSFFKDLQFLLIGPLWLLAAVYRRLHWLGPETRHGVAHG